MLFVCRCHHRHAYVQDLYEGYKGLLKGAPAGLCQNLTCGRGARSLSLSLSLSFYTYIITYIYIYLYTHTYSLFVSLSRKTTYLFFIDYIYIHLSLKSHFEGVPKNFASLHREPTTSLVSCARLQAS